jgi:hypothetical protein
MDKLKDHNLGPKSKSQYERIEQKIKINNTKLGLMYRMCAGDSWS